MGCCTSCMVIQESLLHTTVPFEPLKISSDKNLINDNHHHHYIIVHYVRPSVTEGQRKRFDLEPGYAVSLATEH